jgi:thioredoxin 1
MGKEEVLASSFLFNSIKGRMSKFIEIINSEQAVLVDFFAEWCGPCKTMGPILQQLANKHGKQLRILKVDVDKNPQLAQKYGVRGVPTLILFRSGQIKWQQSGVIPLDQLSTIVNSYTTN